MENSVLIRFYEELNSYLPSENRKQTLKVDFRPACPVGDLIASFGVPLQEIDLVLVNGESAPLTHRLINRDRVSVYPVFESFDIGSVTRIRENPLRDPRFITDVHLGKLSKYLRVLGFDTMYANDFTDEMLVSISLSEHRTLLSRDTQLMADRALKRGYRIRHTDPEKQLIEVLQRFDLVDRIQPMTRCLQCNGRIIQCPLQRVQNEIPPAIRLRHHDFSHCAACGKIFWNGDHVHRMRQWIRQQIARCRAY